MSDKRLNFERREPIKMEKADAAAVRCANELDRCLLHGRGVYVVEEFQRIVEAECAVSQGRALALAVLEEAMCGLNPHLIDMARAYLAALEGPAHASEGR